MISEAIDSFTALRLYSISVEFLPDAASDNGNDLKPMMKEDLHRILPLQRVIDLAQKACWAGPLSKSMFCEEERIEGMTGELLNYYTNWNYKSDHCFLLSSWWKQSSPDGCCFRQWEKDDLAQKACWAGPLSDSMFCKEERRESVTGELFNYYTDWNYKSDHCSVASVGVPFEEIVKLAEAIEPRRIRPAQRTGMCSKPRGGFEYYELEPGSDTWICVVVPGCGTNDIAELIRHSIVAHACGSDNMQEGSHSMDITPEYPLGALAGGDLYTSFKAFNISYYETGVFGIVARTRACSARNVAKAAAQFLSNVGDLDFSQIDIGKKRLKVSLAVHDDDCIKLAEGLALQFVNCVQMDNAKTAMKMIDSIQNQEIKDTAKTLGSKLGRDLAVAIVGDLACVPHDKELLCR